MMTLQNRPDEKFNQLLSSITDLGRDWHELDIIENAEYNREFVKKTLKDLPRPKNEKAQSAIVISAGPSVHKLKMIKKIKEANFKGSVIAVDGAYVACLKEDLIPDYVLTLDPHPTRMVRWFGDPDFEKNSKNDDYFKRQDLNIDFRNDSIRENQKNIDLINKMCKFSKLITCTTAPKNVVKRVLESKFDIYWWNPLMDDPKDENSLTRKMYNINKIPCMNTGGTVGTAAWVFASSILKVKEVAVVGMDLGYYSDTPVNMTQTYYELQEFADTEEDLQKMFVYLDFPLTGETFYTDPTYYWYRKNFIELVSLSNESTFNCSEAGTLFGDGIDCIYLDSFLRKN